MRALALISRSIDRIRRGVRRSRVRVTGGREKRDGAALLSRIAASRSALLEFGQTSDHEFSGLARGLSDLNAHLADLRVKTDALNAVLQDRDEDRAISSAYALYKNSVDLVHSSAGIVASAQQQLAEVETGLQARCSDRAHFDRDYLFQRIITLSIRIEASRLPADAQAVFLNVASAIAETGEQIQRCTEGAFGRIEEVLAESRAARKDLAATEQELHSEARQSIDRIQRELSALQTALAPCAEQGDSIRRLLGNAQPQTLNVIAALQHQDIVRQKLEHVSDGFQDIEEHLRSAGSPGIEWDYVHHAARVQAAHLETSRQEIELAGESVVGGLEAVLGTSASLVDCFSSMETAAATALGRCRIAEIFAEELRELTRIIGQSEQANLRTARLVERIGEVVRLFTQEITQHEFDVKIVAVNAQIAAARLSSADALNRLAEETSLMSDANTRATRQLAADLGLSLSALDKVKAEGAEFVAIVTGEKAQLETGLRVVTDKLARLVQQVRTGAEQSCREFAPVHAAGRELLEGLIFPALIEDAFVPAIQLSDELVAVSAPDAKGIAPSESARARIEQHQKRYTMQQENATHAAALGGVAAASAEPESDIELFSAPVPNDVELRRPSVATAAAEPRATISVVPVAITPPASPDAGFGDGIELF